MAAHIPQTEGQTDKRKDIHTNRIRRHFTPTLESFEMIK